VARFGNLFVYRGTFYSPADAAATLYFHGVAKLYAEKPDLTAAEQAFRKSLELDSAAFFVSIELGNVLLKRGARDEALLVYSDALKHAPEDPFFRRPIEKQIARFAGPASVEIPALRNPFLE
jgi:tetratricopeptide (TPR) repeat protein